MRDRKDLTIAALAAALLFCVGLLVGRGQAPLGALPAVLPTASAQDSGGDSGGFGPEDVIDTANGAANTGGINIPRTPSVRPGLDGRTASYTASDSDSNNRFVAVTTPIGSGESVLFLIDSNNEQVTAYRYRRGKGLEFLAARKIDMDLRITGYQDMSKYSRDEMKRLFDKQAAREQAEAVRAKKGQ